ncbi:MAG: hypothetical protein AB1465_07030 [Patescibacteria group bacterium]
MTNQKIIKTFFAAAVLVLGMFMLGVAARASWETEVLEKEYSLSGQDNAIALDSQGNPVIVYDYNGQVNGQWVYQLKYAKKTASGWASEVIETTATKQQDVGFLVSLDLDVNDNPHLAYVIRENWESEAGPYKIYLKYATKTENGWQKETVISNSDPTSKNFIFAATTGIKVNDFTGYPSIFFIGITDYPFVPKYAYKNLNGWQIESVTSLADFTVDDAMFIFDSNYKPHIITAVRDRVIAAGEEAEAYILHTWRKEDGTWQSAEVIDKKVAPGIWNVWGGYDRYGYAHLSIARDNADNLYVLYHDTENKTLKFAENSNKIWKTEIIDNNFVSSGTSIYNIYFKNSIALDNENHPRIAYHDFMTSNLKYAVKTDAGWQFQTLFSDPISNEGGLPSLVIDSSGNTHMSHIGRSGTSNYAVKYTHYIPEQTFVTKIGTAGVTKIGTAGAGEALGKEKLIGEKDAYLVNNFVFSFLKLPKKLQAKKYYIKNKKFEKYPANYAKAKKLTLKKYWKITSNLKKYKAGKKKNKFSLRLMFAYDQSEFTALQKQNKKLKEKQLKLKYYNVKTGKWKNFAKAKQNTTRNFFYIIFNRYDFSKNTLFVIGK